jgi:ABC-type glutathione transport system ATPase component
MAFLNRKDADMHNTIGESTLYPSTGKLEDKSLSGPITINIDSQKRNSKEDEDVFREKQRINEDSFIAGDHPLIMKNMMKIYEGRSGSGPHLAVNDVSLAVEKNTVFGLLGFVYFLI